MTYLSMLERLAKAEDIRAEWQQVAPEKGREEIIQSIYKWIRTNWQFRWSAKKSEEFEQWFAPRGPSSISREEAIKLFEFLFVPKQIIKTYHWE